MQADLFKMLREFNKAFGVREHILGTLPPPDERDLAIALLREEVTELEQACLHENRVEILDALCDIAYVWAQTVRRFGFHFIISDAIEEVHASNMSKLGATGEPLLRGDGKVLKGPFYTPPDLAQFLPHHEKGDC